MRLLNMKEFEALCLNESYDQYQNEINNLRNVLSGECL